MRVRKKKVPHLFPYEWNIDDGYPAKGIKPNGLKVFSCFACGGGSTMGYKLAGYTVLGCNEIDARMAECYIANHDPKYAFIEPIQDFKNRDDIPADLYDLDILDGSPPCSSFSMLGNREKDWGKKKKFREGQTEQVLDTLFFDFIDLAKELQPKMIVAENVKGIIQGRAKEYFDAICDAFDDAGYVLQTELLNSKVMGVPQSRPRVFFLAFRKDLVEDGFKIDLDFNEREIPYKDIESDHDHVQFGKIEMTKFKKFLWKQVKPGETFSKVDENGNNFGDLKVHPDKPVPTIAAVTNLKYHYAEPRALTNQELQRAGTYPQDYMFLGNKPHYLIGMSVPPVMVAQIANRAFHGFFKQLDD